jgi:cytochrome c6
MTKSIPCKAVLTLMVCLAATAALAQGDVYKSKCAMCHGAAGIPNPAMASAMGIKAATDPSVKALTEAEMIAVVKNGKGKMKPIAGLTDAQVKEAVDTFRSFAK